MICSGLSIKSGFRKFRKPLFICAEKGYKSSNGVSGLMANCPVLALAGFSGCDMGAAFSIRRGGVGVSFFLSFPRLNSFRYFAKVGGFTSIPFSCSFSAISWVSKPRFFIRSSVGARAKIASFTVMLRLPSRVTLTGLSLVNSNLISLTKTVVSCIFDGAMPRILLSDFGGRAARSPTFYEVKHSELCFCLSQRLGADSTPHAHAARPLFPLPLSLPLTLQLLRLFFPCKLQFLALLVFPLPLLLLFPFLG